MKRNSTPPTLLILFLAVFLPLGGCGWLGSLNQEPPAKPHVVTIAWAPSTSHVIGYNVYRATPPGAPFGKLTPQPLPATEYPDHTVEAGKTYVYFATSVSAKGIESKPSENKIVTVPSR